MKLLTLFAIMGLLVPSVARAQTDTSSSITLTGSDPPPQTSSYIGVPSSGGTTAACPSGKMIIGVGGTKLKFVQKITPICGSYTKDGNTVSSSPIDVTAIALGGSGFKLECGRSKVVTKLRVAHQQNTTTYPYIGGVEISCLPWVVGQWMADTPQVLATSGFDSWQQKPSVSCASQMQPARSLRVRATTSVKALSIICDEP